MVTSDYSQLGVVVLFLLCDCSKSLVEFRLMIIVNQTTWCYYYYADSLSVYQ